FAERHRAQAKDTDFDIGATQCSIFHRCGSIRRLKASGQEGILNGKQSLANRMSRSKIIRSEHTGIMTMKRIALVLTIILSARVAHAQTAPASAGPAPTGLVVNSGNYFSPIVSDLEKAIAFYGAIGFQFQGEPANADANPQLRAMFGLPDARLRYQIGRAPSIAGGVEIIEVSKA